MSFKRDPRSGALINTDDAYYKSIVAMRAERAKAEEVRCEMDQLRCELSEIKNLLKSVLSGKNYG